MVRKPDSSGLACIATAESPKTEASCAMPVKRIINPSRPEQRPDAKEMNRHARPSGRHVGKPRWPTGRELVVDRARQGSWSRAWSARQTGQRRAPDRQGGRDGRGRVRGRNARKTQRRSRRNLIRDGRESTVGRWET